MKIYRLLRNNKQMGCFTATCLLQMNLQKYDLIWVEGESITWKYPSEMIEFRDYSPKAEITNATVIQNRKEKQITYFGNVIPAYDYKEVNIQYIEELDAMLPEIAHEFDCLVSEEQYNAPAGRRQAEMVVDEIAGQCALDEVNAILNDSYSLVDFKPIPDTVESKMDQVVEGEKAFRIRSNVFKNGIAAAVASLIILSAAGYLNLKL
ncbi:MAG TPA: hypothetical protein VFV68_08625 [Agriterribacter sp.]|nr:hypothetical protein [Agriterribacter sp.]